jgi:hypothetical protein
LSPFDRLLAADTAIGCESVRSLAKARRSGVDHSYAPERQASFNGTTWSMSIPEADSIVRPSYSEYQVPLVARHWSSWTTSWPSRWSTTSPVSQVPDWVIQCGKFYLEYPGTSSSSATTRSASSSRALTASGGSGSSRRDGAWPVEAWGPSSGVAVAEAAVSASPARAERAVRSAVRRRGFSLDDTEADLRENEPDIDQIRADLTAVTGIAALTDFADMVPYHLLFTPPRGHTGAPRGSVWR